MLSAGADLLLQLAQGITQALPTLIPTITNVAMQIVTMLTDPGMLTSLIQAGIDMLMALGDGLMQAIPQLIAALPTIIQNICDGLTQGAPLLIDGAIQLPKKKPESAYCIALCSHLWFHWGVPHHHLALSVKELTYSSNS